MHIRQARVDEADALSALARTSKAHWPYPQEQLEAWRGDLEISEMDMAASHIYVVEVDAEPAGFYQLLPQGSEWVLEHFWIVPDQMGKGLGRALLSHAAGLAGAGGATIITIDAEPYAEAFYAACGAKTVGHVVAPIAGMSERLRPQMSLQTTI